MKILIISQYFWPEKFRINDLAEGLVARGHRVTVLTGKPNYPEGSYYPGYGFLKKNKEWYGAIKVIRSPLISRGKNNKIRLALNYLSFACLASLVGIVTCAKPDVIFVYEPSPITVGIPAILFKKIKKVPILFWVQDLWPESVVSVGATRSRRILMLLEKLVYVIYQRCDFILTTSRAYFDSIKRFNINEEKLRYFPQTAEDLYRPIELSSAMAEDKLLPQGFRIIFSGNIGIAQDIENIIQAAILLKEYPEIKWIFLGDGSKRSWLEAAIKENALEQTVFWLGQHSIESMPRFFSCADALLVTLKDDPVFSLTIPAKIQSYFACDKPVLAALNGEGKRIIEEACAGLAVESGDPNALAESALALFKSSVETRTQQGLNGKNYFANHFDRDKLLQNLEEWMMELKERNIA